MIDKDPIQDVFSKAFENHSMPVRPELWAGVQAKMAAAAAASGTGAVAAKGLSALSKWIIGGLITTGSIVTAVVVVQQPNNVSPQHNQVAQSTQQKEEGNATTANKVLDEAAIENSKGNSTKEASIPVTAQTKNEKIESEEQKVDDFVPGKKTVGYTESIDFGSKVKKELKEKTDNENTTIKGGAVDSKGTTVAKDEPTSTRLKPGRSEQPIKNNGSGSDASDMKSSKGELVVPNQFSPNNDNNGDEFQLLSHEHISSRDFNVSVFDAKGTVVFKSDDLDFKWDGRDLNGEVLEEGNYVYMILCRDTEGNLIKKHGYLMIKNK